MPFWMALGAIGLGFLALLIIAWSYADDEPSVRIDPDFEREEAERKAQIDAAFRTHGQPVLRNGYQRNFRGR